MSRYWYADYLNNKKTVEVDYLLSLGNYLINSRIMYSICYIRPIRCYQLDGPSSTVMFYCLIASYHYVIEYYYILSNLKRTAVTLYVVSFPNKLTTMRMLHPKVQPLKRKGYVLDSTWKQWSS
jgi:hypothetical protein